MKVSEVTGYFLYGMILAAGILFLVGNNALAEEVTITTYYPAPYGVYNQLVTQTFGVGDNDGDGAIDASDAPDPAINPGDVWIAGNVGIGTTIPTEALDIDGRIRVRNNVGDQILGVAGDIAEYIHVAEGASLLPGEVAVINPENPRCVAKSTKPYDTLVAGIISSKDQAAMIIGSEEPNNQLLALAGQARVKVALEGGPIQIGDLLTTSSTPGHAMKATDRERMFGAIVGKALESFTGELEGETTGEIVVLVTLQ